MSSAVFASTTIFPSLPGNPQQKPNTMRSDAFQGSHRFIEIEFPPVVMVYFGGFLIKIGEYSRIRILQTWVSECSKFSNNFFLVGLVGGKTQTGREL